MRKHIPNLFTAMNLLSGCFGIAAIFQGDLRTASILVLIGTFFDYLDGLTARLLDAGSPLGIQLDSLADMVTFGILPSFLMFDLMRQTAEGYYPYIAFLIAVASGFRLARFNTEQNQYQDFKGMPTPANAFLICGLVFVYLEKWNAFQLLYDSANMLAVLTIVLSFLLVSNFSFFSLKFSSWKLRTNIWRYIILAETFISLIAWQLAGLFIAMIVYIFLAITLGLVNKTRVLG